MFTAEKYVKAESLDQAYQLNQNRNNCILGGILWLKMGEKKIGTAIDLGGLGLDKIEETLDRFQIGCMCTLRQLEQFSGFQEYFEDAIAQSLRHIVGVQFRNGATVGGSVYSRFGFSDLLTCLLSLNTEVETYQKGWIPLEEYMEMERDSDILVRISIKKERRKVAYLSHRLTETDFPILNCAVSLLEDSWNVVLGARPGKAIRIRQNLSKNPSKEEVKQFCDSIQKEVLFLDNIRGSGEYRRHLAKVLVERGIERIMGEGNAD